jgi:CRISPR-associated protein Csm2
MLSDNRNKAQTKDNDDILLLKDQLDKLSAEDIIDYAEKLVISFRTDKIKANQIRNFYGAVNKLKLEYESGKDIVSKLVLLKPQLAYAEGRNRNTKKFTKGMYDAINKTLKTSNQNAALTNFFILVESVVAYHKFYGDK